LPRIFFEPALRGVLVLRALVVRVFFVVLAFISKVSGSLKAPQWATRRGIELGMARRPYGG
jgi:hypothetical protein